MFKFDVKIFGRALRVLCSGILLSAALGMSLTSAWAQPANDDFENAQMIGADSIDIGTITGSNVGATREGGELDHAGRFGNTSVWFQWTPALDAWVTFDTIGSEFDTLLDVYDGTGVDSIDQLGSPIASNDDFDPALFGRQNLAGASSVTFFVGAGTNYYIALDGFNGEAGSYTLNWKRGGDRASGEFEFTSTNYYGTPSEGQLDYSDQNGNLRFNRDAAGILITVTRKNGSSGKVRVDYETQEIAPDPMGPEPALEDIDFVPTFGTLVFEDYQMSASFIVPTIPDFFGTGGTFFRVFNVALTDAVLDLAESTDLAPPVISPLHGVALVTIPDANPFPHGPRPPPDMSGLIDRAGSIQFERAHYRRTEGVGTARIKVLRRGGTATEQQAAVTVNYLVNRASTGDPLSSYNAFPLSAGSDYATPSTEPNGDWTVIEPSVQSLTIPSSPPWAYIDIPITEDTLTEFNEDIIVQLYSNTGSPSPRIVPPTDTTAASGYEVGFQDIAILTIMYDDYPAGAVDPNHNSDYDANTTPARNAGPGVNGSVYAVAVQADNKTVLAGSFTAYNGALRNRIARMNTNGSLDTAFDPGSGANRFVAALKIAPDGKILVGGAFTSFNGASHNSIVRLNPNGSLDGSFNVGLGADGTVWSVALQADGKILIAGDFTTVNGNNRARIARLNPDGSVDQTFDPGEGPDSTVFSIAADTDNSILIGGEFTTVSGVPQSSIARLGATGLLSTNFSLLIGANGIVYSVVLQPDRKILVGGAFTEFDATFRNSIVRLNADGSLDPTFDAGTGANDTIYSIVLQSDGKILVGGLFTSINTTRRVGVARLFPFGPVDTSFLDTAYNQFAGLVNSFDNLNVNSRNYVFSLATETNGNVIIGGGFSKVGGGRGSRDVRPEQYADSNFLDEDTRATYRNRNNIARLIGGITPGPGNIEFISDTYAVDQGVSRFFVTLARTNYSSITNYLGAVMANFDIRTYPTGAGAAGSEDFTLSPQYGTPRWGSSWNRTNSLANTRMQSDGFYGLNSSTLPFPDTYHDNQPFPDPGEAFIFIDITPGSLDGSKSVKLELSRPKGARINDDSGFNLGGGGPFFYFDLPFPSHTDPNLEWSLGGEFIPLGTALGRSSATLTLVDAARKAGELNFTAAEVVVNENGTNAQVVVTRNGGNMGAVSVQYSTADGTNSDPNLNAIRNQDYTPRSGTLNFADGVTNKIILIPIINDSIVEPDKTFFVQIFNPTLGAKLGTLTNVTVKIIDDDYPNGHLNFTNATYVVVEGTPQAVIGVSRTGGSLGSVSIEYSTVPGGTATPGQDYVSVTNILTWDSGETSVKTFSIPILDNGQVEDAETVLLQLRNPTVNGVPTTAVLGGQTNATLIIKDDDRYGSFGFNSAAYFANENSGSTTVIIVRTNGIAGTVSLALLVTNGGTVTSTLLSFAPGERAKAVQIPINDNLVANTNLILQLGLGAPSPSGAELSQATAMLTIFDDETFNQPPGSVDTTFTPSEGLNDFVYALALQPDGKLLVGGDFTAANGLPRNRIARLHPDGRTDINFSSISTNAGANGSVRAIVPQSDGRILIGGLFTSVSGVARNHIARLNVDGNSDSTFDPGSASDNLIYAMGETFMGDGVTSTNRRILVAGNFTAFNGTPRNGIVRLLNDGSVDEGFNPGTGASGSNATIYTLTVQTDGKVIIGGDFTSFNGISRPHIARLNVDGSLDTTFDPGSGPDASVRALAIQTDGKIVIGGLFESVNGAASSHIARLQPSGVVDSSFITGEGANDSVYAIALQTDGKIVVGGEFTRANGVNRNRINRLNSDGTIDPSINFGTGANSFVAALALQRQGEIILGGGFTEFDGTFRRHVARLYGRSVFGTGRIEFSSANYQVNENAVEGIITVRRRGGTLGTVTVLVSTSNGTAVAGVDYVAVSTNLTFVLGETFQTFTVPIIDNDLIELDKTLRLTLSNTSADNLGNQITALLTIKNDDSAISFASSTYRFSETPLNGNALISLIRMGSSIVTSSVDIVTTTNGTATPTNDFIIVTNTIVFRPGETNKLVSIPIVDDQLIEGDETVSMILSNVIGAILIEPTSATLTIVDDDFGQGALQFSQPAYSVSETGGVATITVLRTNGTLGFVTVNFSAGGGTATAGLDYAPTNGTLSFGPGESSKSFSVRIFDDTIAEGDETLLLTLSNPSGTSVVGTNVVELTILDNDASFTFSTPAYLVNEGDGGVTIGVRRNNGSNVISAVSYRTSNGSASAGADYTPTTNTLVFAIGEIFKTFTVTILEDTLVEGDEFFNVSLFNPTGATQLNNPSNAVVTITDNDSSLSFSTNNYAVDEGATNVAIVVVRTNSSSGTLTVNFATSNATAIAGADYIGTNFSLVFLDGETAKTILIPITDDTLPEGEETFTVRLTNPSTGVVLGSPGVATVTIIDNDAGLKFSSPTYRISESGVTATITVLRTTVTNTTVSVNYSASDGTARDTQDYVSTSGVLTFTNGETAKTFTVSIIDDTLIEGDETVLLSLFSPSGQATVVSPGAAVLTIVDNDGSLIVAAGSALVSESITPTNGVIDPGETVSLYFAFRNTVGTDTTNLVATLLPGGGVTSPSGPQSYGVLRINGNSVSRLFSFTASGTNGQRITATFQLRDGAFDLGTATFTYALGRTTLGFTNSASILISDSSNPPTPGSPYPSTLNVTGVAGTVSQLSVTLSNVSHAFPDDIDLLLVSPTGEKVMLMSDAGGGSGFNSVTITFDDAAAGLLPDSGLIASGSYKPTDYVSTPADSFPVPAPTGPYASTLSAFNGINPNGAWSLFVVDDTFFQNGNIANGWSLSLNSSSGLSPIADMSVTITDSPDPAATNNALIYTVTIVNSGPSPVTGVVVTNVLPAGVTFVSASCNCLTNVNNTLIGNLGALAKDGTVSFTVRVTPTMLGVITNTVSVFANEVDPNLLNNVATEVTTVDVPRADLAISLSGSPNPVLINGTLTYSIVVSNLGPVTATGVTVTNTLPAGAVPLSATSSQGTIGVVENNYIFNLGTLAPTPAAATISITVRPTIAGTITNFATVTSGLEDPFKSNNSASVKTVVEQPSLALRFEGNLLALTWGTNAPGYVLETTTNLSPPIVWSRATNYPVSIVNGENRVTINPTNGIRFFRLRQ